MLQLKICGITRASDAALAADLGADLIGLIFTPASARCIAPERAPAIVAALNRRCQAVGVFQNQDAAFIDTVRQQSGLAYVQLHGNESADETAPQRPAIKSIDFQSDAALIASYDSKVDFLLFDRAKGATESIDLLGELKRIAASPPTTPFFVAGGINSQNVQAAVAILKDVRNFAGIDAASSIESSPGIKDRDKMANFINAFKEATSYAGSR